MLDGKVLIYSANNCFIMAPVLSVPPQIRRKACGNGVLLFAATLDLEHCLVLKACP